MALDGLNLSIDAGEVFGLIGPNGAGKTTTLKILATILRPTAGTVRIGGFDLRGQASEIRRLIGYMPDFAGVYDDMRVDEYLRFFAAANDLRDKKATQMVADVLELTDLTFKREAMVESLSRGMRQRLGVARVLLHDPKILLLDEPASGLDPRARVEMRMLLKELRSMGKTIIISSHILSELAEICTSVAIIENGRIFFQGRIDELMHRCRTGTVVHLKVGGHRSADPDTERVPSSDAASAESEMIRAESILNADKRVDSVSAEEGVLVVRLTDGHTDASFIPESLIEHNFRIQQFTEELITLEDAFMRLTSQGSA